MSELTLDFDSIPDVEVAPKGAEKSLALSALPPAGRRTLMKGMLMGAATIGWGVAGASSKLTTKAYAETGPGGLTGWDANDCKDAYPSGYYEESDNTGSYTTEYGACFGGTYIGDTYCTNGWHKSAADNTRSQKYTPISSACGLTSTKNAWKWTTPDGKVWRCSDGHTTVYTTIFWIFRTSRTYLTICRERVA